MSSLTALVLWNTGWSAVLAIIVFGAGRLPALQRRPALRHLLWFGVLLRLIVPAMIAIPVLPDVPTTLRVEADLTNVVPRNISVEILPTAVVLPPDPPIPTDPPLRPAWLTVPVVLVALSLAGTCLLLTLCFLRHRRIARLQRESQDASPQLSETVQRLAREMKLTVVPRVRIVNGLATPSVWGFGRRATILLPRHLLAEFDKDQWSCILAHELAHLARGDLGFNLIAAGVLQLFWWNPVAWWAWREMRACQEASCDALALSHASQSRRRYAETLLQVVDSWNRPSLVQPHVLLGFGNQTVLTRRFEMIADSSVRPRAAIAATLCLTAFALTFFCLPVKAGKKEAAAAAKKVGEAENESLTELNQPVNEQAENKSRRVYLQPVTVVGTARDENGRPMANAKVYLNSMLFEDIRRVVETTTDAEGRYRLNDVKLPMTKKTQERDRGVFEILGVAKGYGFAWRPAKICYVERDEQDQRIVAKDTPFIVYADEIISLDLKFPASARLQGRVIDREGRPIEGMKLQLRHCVPIDEPSIPNGDPNKFNPHAELMAMNHPEVVPAEVKVRQTGKDGTFEFTDLPPECMFRIDLRHPDDTHTEVWMATADRKLPKLGGESVIHSGFAELKLPADDAKKASQLILKYDDGKPDGKRSIAGTGEMIHFVLPDQSQKLKSLRLHCARYGYPKAPDEDVKVYVVSDDEATVVHTELVPYAKFQRGDAQWTTIDFKRPVEAPAEFWVIVDFNAEKTKGVYLSFDTSTEGKHSKTGLPGQASKKVSTGGDWMIQAVLSK